jgi:hypothetical protein
MLSVALLLVPVLVVALVVNWDLQGAVSPSAAAGVDNAATVDNNAATHPTSLATGKKVEASSVEASSRDDKKKKTTKSEKKSSSPKADSKTAGGGDEEGYGIKIVVQR